MALALWISNSRLERQRSNTSGNLFESRKDWIPFTEFYDSLILGTRGTAVDEKSSTPSLMALTSK